MRIHTHEEMFWKFHRQNPTVFDLFRRFALRAKASGRQVYSARAIVQRIRWEVGIETQSDDGFKISNNHVARYARLLEITDPQFSGFFRHRDKIELTLPDDINPEHQQNRQQSLWRREVT